MPGTSVGKTGTSVVEAGTSVVEAASVVEALPLVTLTLPPTSLPPPSHLNHIIPVSKPVCGGYGCDEAAYHKSG